MHRCRPVRLRHGSDVQVKGQVSRADAFGGMQTLSLFSCAMTVVASPLIIIFDTSATSLGAKAGIAATLCSFGVFTTGMHAALACDWGAMQEA